MGRGRTGDPGDVAGSILHGVESTLVSSFDFRRPDRFAPQAVRNLEMAHEIFMRRLGSAWGAALRGVVQVELAAIDQVAYDDYVRALPMPDLMAVLTFEPLPGPVIIDCNIGLALRLLDRLLGAVGDPEPTGTVIPRRPTDIESAVLTDFIARAIPGLEETLGTILEVQGQLAGVEYNPQLLQAAAPGDSVLLFTFLVRVTQGMEAEGMVTLCYPAAAATPLVDRLTSLLTREVDDVAVDDGWRLALRYELESVQVDLQVTLDETAVPAVDLAALQVGDVLRLDHRVDRPVRGHVEGRQVLTAHLGRRGRRLGIQVLEPPRSLTRPDHGPQAASAGDPDTSPQAASETGATNWSTI